ncbi:MAG: uridine kinase [Trueperaceae bacterium]|nr:uridine kinase [Trueperaceae bacterium]
MTERPKVIGLAGGTGSGKTTVAKALLAEAGPGNALLLPQDAYYRAQGDMPFEARVLTNYDEPSAFDTELLVQHVDRLAAGESVERPVYDFAQHDRSNATLRLAPAPIIIVEGILVLFDPHLRERMQLKVFVDAPPDERFIRRLERDVEERGRSAQSVIAQYRRTVKPMHDLFVEPTKQYADLILPEGGKNRVALEVLVDHVDAYLRRHGRGRA